MSPAGESARLAVIAGRDSLPRLVLAAAGANAVLVRMRGVDSGLGGIDVAHVIDARVEQLGKLFDDLRAAGVRDLVLAGGIDRPQVDPQAMDAESARLMPELSAAMAGGDDALLRLVIAIFERQGFTVRAPHEIVPGLTLTDGALCGPDPTERDRRDAARGRAILAALSPADVGQGVVVAHGLCLGVETVQGTDAMLGFVRDSRAAVDSGRGGVFVKRAKAGQDLRVDMPTIGPATLAAVAEAGLSGICLQRGAVLVLERDEVVAEAERLSIAIWAVP